MELEFCIGRLRHQYTTIRQFCSDVSPEESRWKPDDITWSILEVVSHVYDKEHRDFRPRLIWLLETQEGPWPEIDPLGWVEQHRYNIRDLPSTLEKLKWERDASLNWLEAVEVEDAVWKKVHPTPAGDLRAGDLLAAWMAHDLLHLRQITEMRLRWSRHQLPEYDARYAGTW